MRIYASTPFCHPLWFVQYPLPPSETILVRDNPLIKYSKVTIFGVTRVQYKDIPWPSSHWNQSSFQEGLFFWNVAMQSNPPQMHEIIWIFQGHCLFIPVCCWHSVSLIHCAMAHSRNIGMSGTSVIGWEVRWVGTVGSFLRCDCCCFPVPRSGLSASPSYPTVTLLPAPRRRCRPV